MPSSKTVDVFSKKDSDQRKILAKFVLNGGDLWHWCCNKTCNQFVLLNKNSKTGLGYLLKLRLYTIYQTLYTILWYVMIPYITLYTVYHIEIEFYNWVTYKKSLVYWVSNLLVSVRLRSDPIVAIKFLGPHILDKINLNLIFFKFYQVPIKSM